MYAWIAGRENEDEVAVCLHQADAERIASRGRMMRADVSRWCASSAGVTWFTPADWAYEEIMAALWGPRQ